MPSSGRASGNRSTPPKMSPRLPSRTQVALPSYQSAPSTSISAPNALRAQVARPAPQVRRAADPLLEVVGVADHRRVEPGAGHHGEALLAEAADVEPPAIAAQPDGDGALDVRGDPEVGREQVRRAGRQDREARVGAGEHARCTAAPSRPRPRRTRARRPRRAPGRTCSGAFFAFGTSYQSGSSTPAASSTRRSSGSPPSSVFSAWATTATFMRPAARGATWRTCASLRAAGACCATPAERQANSSTSSAPMPMTSPPATSSGWCMPRYIRDERDDDRDHDRDRPRAARAAPAVGNRDVTSSDEAGVDRDRRRRVTGREAGVGGQVLEALDVGPLARHRQRRDAVGRRLDHQRRRPRRPRSATCAATRTRARSRPTRIGSSGAPPSVEPTSEASVRNGVRSATIDRDGALVGAGQAAGVEQHVGHEQPERDGDQAEHREAREHRGEEHRRGMPSAQPAGEPLGRPARAGVEHGNGPASARRARPFDVERVDACICLPPRSAGYNDPC